MKKLVDRLLRKLGYVSARNILKNNVVAPENKVQKILIIEPPREGMDIARAWGIDPERAAFLQMQVRSFHAELSQSLNELSEKCMHPNEFYYCLFVAGIRYVEAKAGPIGGMFLRSMLERD